MRNVVYANFEAPNFAKNVKVGPRESVGLSDSGFNLSLS